MTSTKPTFKEIVSEQFQEEVWSPLVSVLKSARPIAAKMSHFGDPAKGDGELETEYSELRKESKPGLINALASQGISTARIYYFGANKDILMAPQASDIRGEPIDVSEIIAGFLYLFTLLEVRHHHGGSAVDGGVFGALSINVAAGKTTLVHNELDKVTTSLTEV
jgi:hypothetical protein